MGKINIKFEDALNSIAELYDSVRSVISKAGVFTELPDHPLGGIVASANNLYGKNQGILLHFKQESSIGRMILHIKILIDGVSIKPSNSTFVDFTIVFPFEVFEREDFQDELRQLYSNNKNLSEFGAKSINFVKKYRQTN